MLKKARIFVGIAGATAMVGCRGAPPSAEMPQPLMMGNAAGAAELVATSEETRTSSEGMAQEDVRALLKGLQPVKNQGESGKIQLLVPVRVSANRDGSSIEIGRVKYLSTKKLSEMRVSSCGESCYINHAMGFWVCVDALSQEKRPLCESSEPNGFGFSAYESGGTVVITFAGQSFVIDKGLNISCKNQVTHITLPAVIALDE